MCDGIVVEAHAIRMLRDEIAKGTGFLFESFEWLTQNCGIIMTDKIKTHWETQLGSKGEVVFDWLEQESQSKSVHELTTVIRISGHHRKKIKVDFGLTEEPFVLHYIDCANSTNKPRYILAEDIFLYDPKSKDKSEEKKKEIKNNGSAKLQRYLNEELNIKVSNIPSCTQALHTDSVACSNRNAGHACQLL